MECPSTYYQLNRESILSNAHSMIQCECGQNVKRGVLSSHRTHSPRHRIWKQMIASQEAIQRAVSVAPLLG